MNVQMYLNYEHLLTLDSVVVHKLRVPGASQLNGKKHALRHLTIINSI
jgi:hypothetical protein